MVLPIFRPTTSPTRTVRRAAVALLTALTTLAGVVLVSVPAQAASDYGHSSASYSGVTHPPTSDKPQSKLWYNAGSWWATMWTTGKGWHIWKLDRSTESWTDTGVLIDSRTSTLTDTLWDGSHLFVSAQVATVSTLSSPAPSKSGQPAKLYRYSYSNGAYKLDSGFPTNINNYSSESLTIDEDSTGAVWSTWVQISGTSSSNYKATVYVNKSSTGGTSWGTPFVVPTSDPNPSIDDISAVVAFKSKIGVMWSDETAGKVFFALHPDGSSSSSGWTTLTARSGTNSSDDHINLKTIQADSAGRVFAALKTSADLNSPANNSDPGIVLVTYTPGTNGFQTTTVSTVGDCQTRPQIMLDSEHGIVHVLSAGPSTSTAGCPHSGTPGAIYEKTSSLTNPSFASGRGTAIIQDGSSANVNDPTTSKQSVTSATGLVVLASNDVTKRYWFSDESLGSSVPAPTASFTASPSSGTAPLAVQFTDTSTGAPTSWSWAFGDGATSTSQNPSHSYTSAGTYTATLTATNASGSDSTSKTITVTTAGTAPTASFTASPSSGTAPLAVQFTDTSTGAPTSWSWAFGDGATSTSQNPSHSYTSAGTYTATLTATNASGSDSTSKTITVTTAGGGGGSVTAGSSTTAVSTAKTSSVTVTKPGGVADGDVLIAEFNTTSKPSVSSTPSGWSPVTSALASGANTVFAYYHVVSSASSEPASYTFGLSTSVTWNAGATDYHGVDTANPWDTAASTQINSTAATTITVPGVTTSSAGGLVVGGAGLNSGGYAVTPPTGYTEEWESTGAQVAEAAHQSMPTAGASGDATFKLGGSRAAAAWLRALRAG